MCHNFLNIAIICSVVFGEKFWEGPKHFVKFKSFFVVVDFWKLRVCLIWSLIGLENFCLFIVTAAVILFGGEPSIFTPTLSKYTTDCIDHAKIEFY